MLRKNIFTQCRSTQVFLIEYNNFPKKSTFFKTQNMGNGYRATSECNLIIQTLSSPVSFSRKSLELALFLIGFRLRWDVGCVLRDKKCRPPTIAKGLQSKFKVNAFFNIKTARQACGFPHKTRAERIKFP